MQTGRHMFSKWGTLLFCHNLHRKAPLFIALEATQQCGEKKWTPPGSSITPAASYAPQKMKKGGKQMAKQINYTKKNHVTCQIYTLCYVVLGFFPSSNGAHFWNWILKTLYIINTLHTSSIYRGRFFFFGCCSLSLLFRCDLINGVCSWHLCSF